MRASFFLFLLLTTGCTESRVRTETLSSSVDVNRLEKLDQDEIQFQPIKILPPAQGALPFQEQKQQEGSSEIQPSQLAPQKDPLAGARLVNPNENLNEFLAQPLDIPLDENGTPLPIPVPSKDQPRPK